DMGIGAGDRVATQLVLVPEHMILMYACFKIGAMLRGVTCKGEGQILDLPDDLAPISGSDGGTAPPPWETSMDVDPLAPYIYDACADIEFPIHTSPKFARDVGLPGILVQGTATLAWAVGEITARACGGNPHRIREVACRFTGMVLPGTSIEIRCLDRRDGDQTTTLHFEVLNAENQKAIRNGYVKIERES
ncbi:MAG: hypothetical protein MI747_06350, partial [Desulfobacterales bacterium]|nr:hypothetical protein [Desulfobacterales bacterium]